MSRRRERDPDHLRGLVRLAQHGVLGLADLVEEMHAGIARPWTAWRRLPGRTRGLTGVVYRSIRWTARQVGDGLDIALALASPRRAGCRPPARREELVAVLNGVVGDHLAATANPLAIPLRLRRAGRDLPREREALAAALPGAGGRLLLLVHGLCRSDAHWRRGDHDHGAALERDLGWTAVAVRYNSGRHVSENGRELAAELERLVALWPVPVAELAIVGHSMGGLVARSACQIAGQEGAAWPGRLHHLVFLGTPHHGAPLERGGLWLHRLLGAAPYARPLARLGAVRSAGITDLRHGNLLAEDWRGRDRFAPAADRRRPVPLPAGVRCGAIAGLLGAGAGSLRSRLAGDGLVPLASALGSHPDQARTLAFPPDRQWVGRGIGHFDLLAHPEVYARLRDWLGG
ncbi:MAG: GPI inositol-deacylase [Thermoanaerobaculia bacterium]|nr:GPI inositol-deacylase [Thermoanaerobaculia bacterium]